jgi:hypothetical protein
MEATRMSDEQPRDLDAIFRDGSQIDAAIRKAARLALLAHKREGLPVPVWQDGKTVWIQPDEIEVPEDETKKSGGG